MRGGGPGAGRLPAYPPVTLHQLFQLQVWRTPDARALKCGEQSLTYRELDETSNHLAHRLIEAGTRPGDVVAVAGHRSLGLFAGLLAVLKAGGVFLHLDPELPASRIRQYVGICRPAVELRTAGAAVPATGLPEEEAPAVPVLREVRPPDVTSGPEDPAYILFTSGSTGLPKAVLRPHRLHTSRVFLEQRLYGLGADDRHLLKLPVSARELFWPLATGGTAVIAEPGGERDDAYLIDLLQRERISVISLVPSMLRVLTADPRFARLPGLRHVFVGGEALPPDLEERVRGFGYEVHNTYTLTEADYVAHRRGPVEDSVADATVIGTPLDMRVYLCDERGRRVPPGTVGEMWAGGPGLASGYLGDPERTAERFVPNPFGDPDAPVLFRTGDLARYRPDGSLEYRGRRDSQIKVRGHRVEPTEVELVLREHPGVRDAAVAGYPDPEQGAVLVAFFVADEHPPGDGELRAFLTERLPRPMVPRHLVELPRLPQLPSGKVDRASLEPPALLRPRELAAPKPAEGPTQTALLAVWRRVLRTESVGVDDRYTDLGGDSLRLMVLRAAIRDELGYGISLADLLRAPTVRAQAELIEGAAVAGRPTPVSASPSPSASSRARAAAADSARRAALRSGAGSVDSRKDSTR
ncbi:non-ribosomal peptide synthetase [Streptomyces sp. NPDC046909]|uniref:non-ribosomal peptide synthetase n=1 Tax=Streptomyces sp. NPDC046909 TaxID=3155617 RepID=UPI0033E84212